MKTDSVKDEVVEKTEKNCVFCGKTGDISFHEHAVCEECLQYVKKNK